MANQEIVESEAYTIPSRARPKKPTAPKFVRPVVAPESLAPRHFPEVADDLVELGGGGAGLARVVPPPVVPKPRFRKVVESEKYHVFFAVLFAVIFGTGFVGGGASAFNNGAVTLQNYLYLAALGIALGGAVSAVIFYVMTRKVSWERVA